MSFNMDLIPYRGAFLYEVSDGYEANFKGFHYFAETLEELKSVIDAAISNCDIEKTLQLYSAQPDRSNPLFEDNEQIDYNHPEGSSEWEAVFNLQEPEFDDNLENTTIKRYVLKADDFSSAVKYAQQYLRIQQLTEETAEEWQGATLVSIQLK